MQFPLKNKEKKEATREADGVHEGGKGQHTGKLCLKRGGGEKRYFLKCGFTYHESKCNHG